MDGARGFVLQPTYRIERGRPVVHLYGVLEDGGSFLVRDDRCVPRFWIRARDGRAAERLGASVRDETEGRVTFEGDPVVAVEVGIPGDAPAVRDRLQTHGIACFEADVRFAYRYLIDRGIRGALDIRGPSRPGRGVTRVFENPLVAPAGWTPTLSVLSIDIETTPRAERLLSIALVGRDASEVLLLTEAGATCPPTATPCATERALLEVLVDRIRTLDPDVITGWNVVGFDLAVLQRRAEHHALTLPLGRGEEGVRLRSTGGPWATQSASVPGRLVMDGIDLLRGAFIRLEDYSLDGAAHAILGERKKITGAHRAGAILDAFEHDRPHLVEYNRHDAQLVLDILEHHGLIALAVERSLLTGMPPDRVAASIASFDFLYLSELAKRRVVAPSVREIAGLESQAGGHVLEPAPGLYRNVLLLDFKSLYPSIIRTFGIDPLGRLAPNADAADAVIAPNGVAFARTPGILPALLDDLFARREAAKRDGDATASYAIKILMNSFYGVLGTPTCRFAAPELVNAITGFGRLFLLWTKAAIEDAGYRVLYGDTDSLFVLTGVVDPAPARALGARLVGELNTRLAAHIETNWRVTSRLELELETLYLRLLLPAARGRESGARKRYAGLVDDPAGPRVVFTGLEAVRRDWTDLARRVQRELYTRLFTDRPIDGYLRDTVAALRGGALDEQLIYRKGLRRRLETYTSTTPPHVAAARKMRRRPGRVIRYVVTRAGPEPADERVSPIDHEHYVQKQVRAVAEPVLTLLGLDFDRVIGDEDQLMLFP